MVMEQWYTDKYYGIMAEHRDRFIHTCTYLGVIISSRMVWSRALQTLAEQSRKGVMKSRSTIYHACGDMPV